MPARKTTVNTETGEIGTVRPFADVLRELNHGQVADETAIMLSDLVQAVRAHGKKGKLTLSIEVAPMKGSSRNVLVAAQAKIAPPVGDPVVAVFFDDEHGNVHRNDPNQPELDLPLREVARPDAVLRSAE